MENTIANKEKFYAQYFGQNVLCYHIGKVLSRKNILAHWVAWQISEGYLELKSLLSVSDEDAHEIGFFGAVNFNSCVESYGFERVINEHISHRSIDYLRSKGYLLPFMDASVEDILNFGWAKIKTE